jgi:hypothetical protein
VEPDSEAIVCDNFMRFSERTFIHMMTKIIKPKLQMACQKPGKTKALIHPLITEY